MWWELDVPWKDRAPDDKMFEQRRSYFERHGMVATVQAWFSERLVGLSVSPRDEFMKAPPNRGTPWHISIAFDPRHELLEAFLHDWSRPQVVKLHFSHIKTNAVATLAPGDPIARNAVIRRMHDEDSVYRSRPLHVTF